MVSHPSFSTLFFFFFFFSSMFLQSFIMCVKSEPPAMYVFGDSLSDSGNNNFLPTKVRANYLPYGVDFKRGPTGRFTNGRTTVDFVAERIGLPYAPPYLSISNGRVLPTLTGLNYASASAGILPETGTHLGKCLSLDRQLDFFARTVKYLLPRRFSSSETLSEYLSKAVFYVSIGNNDYINNYLQPEFYNSSKLHSPQEFAQILIEKLSTGLQRLYKLGARKIVVSEIGAVGCLPAVTTAVRPEGACVDGVNQQVMLFNAGLSPLLDRLKSELPGLIFVKCGNMQQGIDIIKHPSNYGFVEANNQCCKSKNGELCSPGEAPCKDRKAHLFFDSFHPTEAANFISAASYFSNQSMCTPMNFEGLVLL